MCHISASHISASGKFILFSCLATHIKMYLLLQPSNSNNDLGFRTILAYNSNGHRNRVNFYSNPNVVFSPTGTPTGIVSTSNNARVITDNRFVYYQFT